MIWQNGERRSDDKKGMRLIMEIKSIVYEKKAMPTIEEHFKLEIEENINLFEYTINKNKIKAENINNKLVIQFIDDLFRIIDDWKSNYENSNLIDGTEWNLQIMYRNGKIQSYSGRNNFPNNFECIEKIKSKLIDSIWGEKYEYIKY